MTRIHHQHTKKAQRLGVHLIDVESHIRAYWPNQNVEIWALDSSTALQQIDALQQLYRMAEERDIEIRSHCYKTNPTVVFMSINGETTGEGKTPMQWLAFDDPFAAFADSAQHELEPVPNGPAPEPHKPPELGDSKHAVFFEEDPAPTINKVPTDGALAYQQGFPAADCPFEDGTDEFTVWNDQWDDAADNAEEAEEEKISASVVKDKFRARYAEAGHPTHCGDELATKLNSLVGLNSKTDLDLFDRICTQNGVDLSKYKRTGNGWQGRLRMTGRNLLAKRVHANGGQLLLPETLHEGCWQMSAEWMASQKFKGQ